MGCDGHRHVVREGIHIDRAFHQGVDIIFRDVELDVVFLPKLLGISRITAETLDVAAIEDTLFPFVAVEEDILWIFGMRIVGDAADHTADHVVRIDLMTDLDRLGRSDKLVVQMLVGVLEIGIRHILRQEVDRVVDLIER